jgi:hypothetical protein
MFPFFALGLGRSLDGVALAFLRSAVGNWTPSGMVAPWGDAWR